MVRLKVLAYKYRGKLPEFQFHYGTIKRTYTEFSPYVIKDFNSTMVRLKGDKPNTIQIVFVSFQFHYGTIKRQQPKDGY